jgi:hypothetical protein
MCLLCLPNNGFLCTGNSRNGIRFRWRIVHSVDVVSETDHTTTEESTTGINSIGILGWVALKHLIIPTFPTLFARCCFFFVKIVSHTHFGMLL